MSAVDPIPGAPYGECATCGISLETEADSRAHMSATMDEAKALGKSGRSHSVRVTNPPRVDRIRRRVGSIVADAIERAVEHVMEDVDRLSGVTEDELRDALGWADDHLDLADARAEWLDNS